MERDGGRTGSRGDRVMSDDYNLCFSPNSSSLAFSRTSKRLIYKKPVVPPSPPSVYGDVYVVATAYPTYLPGHPAEGYEQYYDPRMYVTVSVVGWSQQGGEGFTTAKVQGTLDYNLTRGDVYAQPYGSGNRYNEVTPFNVDVSVTQPSSGAQFSFSLDGQVGYWSSDWHIHWVMSLYADSSRRLTNVVITPNWTS